MDKQKPIPSAEKAQHLPSNYRQEDPHAAREAKRYESPVPSREFILAHLAKVGRPTRFRDLIEAWQLDEPNQRQALRYRLSAMVRDAQLLKNRRHCFCLLNKVELRPGTVIGHSEGYGFVAIDGQSDDLYLSPKQMRRVFPGDRVLVRVEQTERSKHREAIIHEVLERGTTQLTGQLFIEKGCAYVQPTDQRITQLISIPLESLGGARPEQMVVVGILSQPSDHSPAIGTIKEILGEYNAPGVEIEVAIRTFHLPHTWSDAALKEAEAWARKPLLDHCAEENRRDLRHLPFLTIDGEDAQDFDDAVYCEPNAQGGFRLWVAIADVSHYVQAGSALDQEAALRGHSVYFPGRVLPMLPDILSNELCSLKPKVDRLAFVAEMGVNHSGQLKKTHFFKAIIRSHARLTYTKANQWLQESQNTAPDADLDHLCLPQLRHLFSLYQILQQAKLERGAIELSTTEMRLDLGEDKKIRRIIPVARNDAHRLIESCMLLANVAAASALKQSKLTTLYRVHPPPLDEKVQQFRAILSEWGYTLTGGPKPKPKDFAGLIQRLAERPEAARLQSLCLRTFSQAMYTESPAPHFGLAYPIYTHFTSPIRRYPDLLVHRTLIASLTRPAQDQADPESSEAAEQSEEQRQKIHACGVYCSKTERRADEATRYVISWLKCEYMQDRVGEVFQGTVTGVTHFGLFLELNDLQIEGLVHISSLPSDYYHYDKDKHHLIGERSRVVYQLGDPLRVKVTGVQLAQQRIDFECVSE